MPVAKIISYFCTTILLGLVLVACNLSIDKKRESSDTKLSYQYNVNGCDTGEKSFGDLQSYCDSLLDDPGNHYCARSLRQQEYQAKCAAASDKAKAVAKKSDPEDIQTNSSPDGEDTAKAQTTNVPESPSEDLTQDVVIISHYQNSVRVSPKASGDTLIATLTGKLIVETVSPSRERIHLGRAEKISFAANSDLSGCELTSNDYNASSDLKVIDFTLLGLDSKDRLDGQSCLARLSNFAMTGFVVEFTNVPMGGVLSQNVIPKVVLKVEPQE